MAVYMIRAGESGPVKIGFSDCIEHRLVKMQADNHEKLIVIRIFDGDLAVEATLHEQFSDLRLRGEWFSFSRLMLADLGFVDIPLPTVDVETNVEEIAATIARNRDVFDIRLFRDQHGLIAKIGRHFNIRPAAVSQWQKIPAKRVPGVARLTGIPMHQLRPDLFTAPEAADV